MSHTSQCRRTLTCFASLAGVTAGRSLLGPVITVLINQQGHRPDAVAPVLTVSAVGVIANGLIGTTLAARVRLSRLMLSGLAGTLLGLVLSTAGLGAALLGAFLLGSAEAW